MKKYSKDYFRKQGVKILKTAPKNWVALSGATTAPKNYTWYSNGVSRFRSDYRHVLVKNGGNYGE